MIEKMNQTVTSRWIKAQRNIQNLCEKYETTKEKNGFSEYFFRTASFMKMMMEENIDATYFAKDYDELKALNYTYYEDIVDANYKRSFACPTYAVEKLGRAMGQLFSFQYYRIRMFVGLTFEKNDFIRTILAESFVLQEALYDEHKEYLHKNMNTMTREDAIYQIFLTTYMDMRLKYEKDVLRIEYAKWSPDFDIYSSIATLGDYEDPRYIFRYGMYIGENEEKLVAFFKTVEDDTIRLMADTYTEAYIRGFEKNNVPLAGKKTTMFTYHIGFEPVINLAIENLRKNEIASIEPVIRYNLQGEKRPRLLHTKPCEQMEFDHQNDEGLYLTEEMAQKLYTILDEVLEENKQCMKDMAGVALMEVFGQTPFKPENNKDVVKLNEKQKEIASKATRKRQSAVAKRMPSSEYSFVIISFPVPEIGKKFEEIFNETIKLNTLDEKKYEDIQQKIIYALDQGEKVHITGRNGNKTDLTVALQDIEDITKQTKFENCTADVNVPVGEVFTSPRLKGTNGILHVTEVFLHNLKYMDLSIEFEDGYMKNSMCKNFATEQENKDYIQENLMNNNTTLPLGEFAIGTNTVAYAMTKKYGLDSIIPILIGEKTGPHFAVGDTCYTWAEDLATYNADGREIVAKDNEKSVLRKTNPEDAYTYCHTDITIPYSELDEIVILHKDGKQVPIIKKGRFVLEGTEELNKPLENIVF